MHAAAELVPGAHVAQAHADAFGDAAAAVSALLHPHVEVDKAVVVGASTADGITARLEVADGQGEGEDAQAHRAKQKWWPGHLASSF